VENRVPYGTFSRFSSRPDVTEHDAQAVTDRIVFEYELEPITVNVDATLDSDVEASWFSWERTIEVNDHLVDQWTLLHEVAHALALDRGYSGYHGAPFISALLELAQWRTTP
jgi:hypothetical protein